jgi:serine/threonine kinase PknH
VTTPPGGAAPDEDTRPVVAVTRRDEQTVVFTPSHPRPTLDDGGQWVDSLRPAPRLEDTYAVRLSAPKTLDSQRAPVKRQRPKPVVMAAAVAGAALVGTLGWFLWPAGDSGPRTPSADAEAQKRLAALLPAGYSPDACTPAELPKGAVAAVNCTKNTDAGGPSSASYVLMKDGVALDAALVEAIANTAVVDCPGNIQSPGRWRRNATPQKIAGTLVCGLPQEHPQVTWTNDARLVLNVARAGPEGPTLDQLYKWWSAHS